VRNSPQRLRIAAVGLCTITRPTRHRGRRDDDAVDPEAFQKTIDHNPHGPDWSQTFNVAPFLPMPASTLRNTSQSLATVPKNRTSWSHPSSAPSVDIASRWTSRPMNFVEMVIVSSFRYTILNAQHPEIPSLGASSHHQGTVIGSITRLKAGSAFCTRPQKSTGKFLVVGPDSQSISEFWQRLRSRTQRQHPRLDKGLFRRGCHLVLDRVWAKYQPGHA